MCAEGPSGPSFGADYLDLRHRRQVQTERSGDRTQRPLTLVARRRHRAFLPPNRVVAIGKAPCDSFRRARCAAGSGNAVCRLQPAQSTATSSAAHTSLIRSSLSRPRRSTSTATETLSTESRFIAHRRGTGSSPGSSTTSLRRLRIVVVHGAMRTRRSLGMATSRDRTTTGRRPMSGSSHHHTSPRDGRGVTTQRQSHEMKPNHPTRRVRRVDVARRRCRQCRSQWLYAVPPVPGALRLEARRR
jgi:hypothetical protein